MLGTPLIPPLSVTPDGSIWGWSVGGDREWWNERRTEIVTRVVTCCLSERSSRLLGNSCANSTYHRYRQRVSCHPEEGTMPPAKQQKLKNEVWMSNDDCNPNGRSRSWVIRLSKKFMKNQSSMVLTVKKRHCPFWKKLLPSMMIKQKNNANSNASKWKI